MKILLIYPKDYAYKSKDTAHKKSINYPGLTIATLAGLVPKELNADVNVLDEGIDDTPINYDVDIIAVSTLTASAKRAYEIADQARKKGVYTVLGGYHVSYNYEEAKKHADTIILGQADETWPKFLLDYKNGQAKEKYTQEKTPDVNNLPWPRWDLLKMDKYINIKTIQTSRGCPNSCKFCTVSDNMFFGANRPIDEVIKEIKHFRSKRIVFLDPNFFANRRYAMDLVKALIPLKIKWACLSTVNVGKDMEMLKLLKKSGCMGALIGLETVCQDNIISMSKRHNRVSEYKEAINNFHKHGILILACYVLGFDNDNKNTFKETVDFIKDSGIDLVRFSALTPFPGTPLYRELDAQGRIINKDWDYYDFQNIVFRPQNLTPKELKQGLEYCWEETYKFRNIFLRALKAKHYKILVLMLNLGFHYMYKKSLRNSIQK